MPKSKFSLFELVFNFGLLTSTSIFGIIPSIFAFGILLSILTSGMFALIFIFSLLISISVFGKLPSNEKLGAFPFKLKFPDGIFNSGGLIFTSLIFCLISNSLFLISISRFGLSILGTFIFGPLIFPSIFTSGTFNSGFFNFLVPGIIPELIIISSLPLIFNSGLGMFPSILIFFPLISIFFKFELSIFGPFIFRFPDGIFISGELIWVFNILLPLRLASRFVEGISSLLEPLRFISGCSKLYFDDLIFISGSFILIGIILDPFIFISFEAYPGITPINSKSFLFTFISALGNSIFGFFTSIPFISPFKSIFPFTSIFGLLISILGPFKLVFNPSNSGFLIEASISGIPPFKFIPPEGRSILGELSSKLGFFASMFNSPEGILLLILKFGISVPILPSISIFGILRFISNSGFLISESIFGVSIFNFGLFISKSIFGNLASISNLGLLTSTSIFGIIPSIFAFGILLSILTSGMFALIFIFSLLISISVFGKLPSNEKLGAFPFKLKFPDGIFNSGGLIFTSLIFCLISNSLFLISISTFGLSILGPLIFPSIFTPGTFNFCLSNFVVPWIIPELIITSFCPLISTFGKFPSTLTFGPLISGFFNSGILALGPFISNSTSVCNLGLLIFFPGISPFNSKSEPFILGVFTSKLPDGIVIPGLFKLISIFLSVSILGPFISIFGWSIFKFAFPERSPFNLVSGILIFAFAVFLAGIVPVIFL